jgi:hypothetical protein
LLSCICIRTGGKELGLVPWFMKAGGRWKSRDGQLEYSSRGFALIWPDMTFEQGGSIRVSPGTHGWGTYCMEGV